MPTVAKERAERRVCCSMHSGGRSPLVNAAATRPCPRGCKHTHTHHPRHTDYFDTHLVEALQVGVLHAHQRCALHPVVEHILIPRNRAGDAREPDAQRESTRRAQAGNHVCACPPWPSRPFRPLALPPRLRFFLQQLVTFFSSRTHTQTGTHTQHTAPGSQSQRHPPQC